MFRARSPSTTSSFSPTGRAGGVDGRVHGEAVIVRSDLDTSGGAVEHRLVDAAVAVAELIGAVAQRPPEDLVAQADAEEGDAGVQNSAQQLDLTCRGARVARPIGEEDAVRTEGEHLGQRRGLRQNVDAHAPLCQLPRGAGLDAQVDGGDPGHGFAPLEASRGLDDVVLARTDLAGQGLTGHGGRDAHGVQADVDGRCGRSRRIIGAGGQGRPGEDARAHGAALAQMPGQRPSVNLAEADHAGVSQLVL